MLWLHLDFALFKLLPPEYTVRSVSLLIDLVMSSDSFKISTSSFKNSHFYFIQIYLSNSINYVESGVSLGGFGNGIGELN